MGKRIIIFFFLLFFTTISYAQVTYSEHIAPIIYDNCTSCHREGEIGPFPLTNYQEVVSWGSMIQYVTEIKYMPPWKPDDSYSNFVGETALSEEEINLIAEWTAADFPQGDPALEPDLPVFPEGSQLGTPDLVLEMSEDYFIEGNNVDDYRVFVLPTGLTEDREVAAVEFRPGNTRAVHHALIAYETEGNAAALDAESSEYGYESFGNFGVQTQGTFTGYTPGIRTVLFPEGVGTTLPGGADLLIQVHYAPLPTDETDRSKVNIFFKEETDPIERELERLPFLPFHLDGGWLSFNIQPDSIQEFHGSRPIEEDISLISVYPHMHYLGKSWELYAITPQGDTIKIIRINDWDFNWQGAYTFDRMKKIPAGSVIHAEAVYDNTVDNPFNPSNPPQVVSWGEGTTDEMYLVGLAYVPYQEGDEDIILGEGDNPTSVSPETLTRSEFYPVFPNPTEGPSYISWNAAEVGKTSVEVYTADGRFVKNLFFSDSMPEGKHGFRYDFSEFPKGVYSIRLRINSDQISQSLLLLK